MYEKQFWLPLVLRAQPRYGRMGETICDVTFAPKLEAAVRALFLAHPGAEEFPIFLLFSHKRV